MSDLTKWPRLLIAGEPVTREQANDILVRTHDLYSHTNDQAWADTIAAEFGLTCRQYGFPDPQSARAVTARLGILDLRYLGNQQIMSSWIGGPHGWCGWDGAIGCSTYNIGKWPDREDVQHDLDTIAAAWPFLRMNVQLVTDEGEGELAAMWVVRDGKAVFVEPGNPLPVHDLTEADVLHRFQAFRAERGVSIERLHEAITQVAGS